jgi:AcrR family transcriptional regulator
MGRRSEHSPEEIRVMALAATRRLLAEHGVTGLTAREIAREIGYSPGTLYNHFADLDDLVLQANAETLDHLLARVHEARAGHRDAEPALRAMARAYMAETRAAPRLWAALFEHRMAKGRPLPDWYAARIAGLFAPVEEVLLPLFGSRRGKACRRTARILWSALHGITSLALSQKLDLIAGVSAEDMADDLITTYLRGLKARGGPASNSSS